MSCLHATPRLRDNHDIRVTRFGLAAPLGFCTCALHAQAVLTVASFENLDRSAQAFTYAKAAGAAYGSWPFDHPQYLLLNVAVGGIPNDAAFPVRMEVDHARLYQPQR